MRLTLEKKGLLETEDQHQARSVPFFVFLSSHQVDPDHPEQLVQFYGSLSVRVKEAEEAGRELLVVQQLAEVAQGGGGAVHPFARGGESLAPTA